MGESLIETGEIDPKGLTPKELHKAVFEKIRDTLKTNPNHKLLFKIDHKDSLLDEARKFYNSGAYEFSIVFYAIWIEHFINLMLISKMTRLDIPSSEHADVLRQNFHQKVGVIWRLLFGQDSLDDQLVKNILKIAEARNAFVHYKWTDLDPEVTDLGTMNAKLIEIIDLAESTISSLNTFRSETIFNGQADSWDKNKLSPTPKTANRQVRRKTKKAK